MIGATNLQGYDPVQTFQNLVTVTTNASGSRISNATGSNLDLLILTASHAETASYTYTSSYAYYQISNEVSASWATRSYSASYTTHLEGRAELNGGNFKAGENFVYFGVPNSGRIYWDDSGLQYDLNSQIVIDTIDPDTSASIALAPQHNIYIASTNTGSGPLTASVVGKWDTWGNTLYVGTGSATGSIVTTNISSSTQITANIITANQITSSLFGTSSWAGQAATASYVVTSITTGSTAPVTLVGYYKVYIGGTEYWTPYYSSP